MGAYGSGCALPSYRENRKLFFLVRQVRKLIPHSRRLFLDGSGGRSHTAAVDRQRLICIWTELSLRKVTGKLRPPLETAYSTLEESVCLAEPYVLKSGPHSPALHPARCANHARLSIRSGRSTPTLQAVSRLCCFPAAHMCRAARAPAMAHETPAFRPRMIFNQCASRLTVNRLGLGLSRSRHALRPLRYPLAVRLGRTCPVHFQQRLSDTDRL